MKQRSSQQNRALHKYCALLAEALNDAGFDMKKTLKVDAEIPWSGDRVKDFLWRPVQDAQLGKESTTELTRAEVSKVYDTLNRHLGLKLNIHVPFPVREGE